MSGPVRAAGLLVYRPVKDGVEYLLLQASYKPFHWTPPKGHVDPGEDEWTAALRETKEEAGINADQLEIDKDFNFIQRYIANGEPKTVAYWLAKLVKPLEVTLSNEHQKMKWLGLEDSIALSKFKEMEEMLRAADNYLKEKSPK
uniref:Bis(5'-nucleosyl)-tetraphosphatase [asymmetrical] n=1 Tax=Panagrolaimus superbus TaxID=310955 RepID=A0A914YCD1_9BILA